jgi:hypothetical protein
MRTFKIVISQLLIQCIIYCCNIQSCLAAEAANLDQIRNGSYSAPVSPANWVNGNAGSSQAHYAEGMSVGYRCVMTGLTAGSQFTIVIGYDIRNSGRNALDYLTHYNRISPHSFPSHTSPETIDPLIGTSLTGSAINTYSIPTPASSGDVLNQPYVSFNSLGASERKMTIYNGTIDTIYYVTQGSLTANTSETRVAIKVTVYGPTAILAWGGHIASRNDWGFDASGNPKSAGGISGSPFHMRLISWTFGSTGSQDRSLSGNAVFVPAVTLPIELLSFNAKKYKEHTELTWITASEKNSDYFIIEKGIDAYSFAEIGTVKASGNSLSMLKYSFQDYNTIMITTYFRLKEIDIDGNISELGVVFVKPNSALVGKEFIYNVHGKLVLVNDTPSDNLNQSGLPDGIYISQCFAGSELIVRKFYVGKYNR